ncbi:enoyl-CoA hydratase-related protein [Pseudonocardia sp. NPDC049154]|uniref:enoyl-CoA hydratase-related protein n=1 Tax=Pseudonocardia sp. NPDC049154 TaxID=3155501 RepID=UPI0034118453
MLKTEQRMRQERHYFFENTRRWRNLRKITIAEVHGKVYSAALMMMWSCDLIVAAEGTTFADVVGTRMGMCGVEYFAHPWEFGARKTKELLLTGDSIDAEEAHALGMVSKVWAREDLAENTEAFEAHRPHPVDDRAAGQGVCQPDPGQPELPQRPAGLLHPAPAQPRALG